MKRFFFAAFFLLLPVAASAQNTQVLEVYDSETFEKERTIELPSAYEKISFKVADLHLDNLPEIVIGSSPDFESEVIFYNLDGAEIDRWAAYTGDYRGGVVVEVSDIDGDAYPNVIVGTRESGGPHVRVFDNQGNVLSQFFAFDPESRAGVTLAAGNVRWDSSGQEIVVAHGQGQPGLMRVFSHQGLLLSEWHPFGKDYYGGINVDVAADGTIIVAKASGESPLVRMFDGFGNLRTEVLAYYEAFPGGVQAHAAQTNYGSWDLFTAPGFSGGPHIRNFNSEGLPLSPGFMAFDGDFKGGLTFDLANVDIDPALEIIVGKATFSEGPYDSIKSIKVDLSEQVLTTYYKGKPVKRYWISSGTYQFPTPTGDFEISRKRESTRMSWFYGPNNPNNYDLPNVPHVLTFYGPYNIHGAYWHNNFGNPMSHGCINMSLPDAEEVFNWSEIGTKMIVEQ